MELDIWAAVGVRAGVLRDQSLAIEVVPAGATPAHEVAGAVVGTALEERPDLVSAGDHTILLFENSRDQRRFKDRAASCR